MTYLQASQLSCIVESFKKEKKTRKSWMDLLSQGSVFYIPSKAD